MKAITEGLFEVSVQRPFLVVLMIMMMILAAVYGGSKLIFKSDYRVFFSEENPQLSEFEKMQATFTKNDSVAFIVAPKDRVVFKEKTLAAIHTLTTKAWQIPYSSRVDSITNYQHTTAIGDELTVEDLVLEPELLPNINLEKLKNIVLNEPVLYKKLIAQDASVTVVNATIQLPGIDPVTELPEVVTKVRQIQADIQKAYPDLEIYLSGMIMLNNAFSESVLRDSATLIPIMFGVVALTMALLLRTISGTVATIIIVMCSILSTMGLVGWMGFYLTGPSVSAPTIIMTLAVADCVHILSTMLYEMRNGLDKKMAILESLRINFQPIFLTSATTAIGFLSMNFSDSPPFRDLGNFVAIGVMLAFIFSMTIFPALLSILPMQVKPEAERKADFMSKVSDFVIAKRKVLLVSFSAIILMLAIFVPQNELDDDFVKYFDTTIPFRQSTDFMQDNMSGLMTQEIEVNSKESGGIHHPEYLSVLARFSDWMRAQPETDNVNILSDTLRRLNKNMHGDNPEYYRLPNDRELSAQYLLLYELSLPYGLDLNNQIDVDKAASRIVVTTRNMTSTENIELEKRVSAWFEENAPQYTAIIASPNLMFAHIGQRNIQSMLLGTSIALVLISLLLVVALRSVKFGFISLIPNLVPAVIGFGLWYFIDGRVGLGLSVVIGMTLGIVVDDTVHFLSKYLRARRTQNKDIVAAVRYTFSSVGHALWITTWVLVAGFMVLAQSSFKLNASMGLLTALTIGIALIIDFLFLPSLLMSVDRDKQGNDSVVIAEENKYVVN
ncbi:RND transporter [Candidatus Endobugula sertula]|uniref:RND transporter n=1 Tax=Candidatus Endobugula sertula TaxID=62101 RepID=A0A1D2QTI8_9GAMM|nr:RND transporter [Candidatus Endobugula sertula]